MGPLILGYANACDSSSPASSAAKIIAEAEAGVNVINWFAANLVGNAAGEPVIEFGLNISCIAEVADTLQLKQLPTAHIMTIGGWDAPHPNTTVATGKQWWAVFKTWNAGHGAQGFGGFDGIDWDLEGNDAAPSPWNEFSPECIKAVGEMSQSAKDDGFLVTMVPPESYFDVSTAQFDLSLRHPYPEWHPEFLYHGRNAYAIWLSKYGTSPVHQRRVWDLVDIQLYESWSHAGYQIGVAGVPAADYLVRWITAVLSPFPVAFGADPAVDWPNSTVTVTPDQLVVGFSFGGFGGKSVFIKPSSFAEAWDRLPQNLQPRGGMFWNIALDTGNANGTDIPCDMAAGLNSFLRARRR